MGHEDTDYSWRAIEAGYKLSAMSREDFGVTHLYDPDKPAKYPEAYKYLEAKYGL
jgi:GT2 family glycosyltransferase